MQPTCKCYRKIQWIIRLNLNKFRFSFRYEPVQWRENMFFRGYWSAM